MTGDSEIENIFWDLSWRKEQLLMPYIYKALKKSLLEAGLDDEYLKSHLIC